MVERPGIYENKMDSSKGREITALIKVGDDGSNDQDSWVEIDPIQSYFEILSEGLSDQLDERSEEEEGIKIKSYVWFGLLGR